jgi:TPR repeat protein
VLASLATVIYLCFAVPAFAQADAASAQFEAGLKHYDAASASKEPFHEGYKKALEIWKPVAEEGHPAARYHVGMLYYLGAGGITVDQVLGFAMIRRVAEEGYPTAQAFLGFLSENGDGLFQNKGDERVVNWYGKAAEGGHCYAIKRMAKAYGNGELGLAKDPAKVEELKSRLPTCVKR